MFILLVKTRFVLYTLPKTKPIGPLLAPRFREFEAVPLPWTTLTKPHKSPRIGSRGFIGLLDSRNGHSALQDRQPEAYNKSKMNMPTSVRIASKGTSSSKSVTREVDRKRRRCHLRSHESKICDMGTGAQVNL